MRTFCVCWVMAGCVGCGVLFFSVRSSVIVGKVVEGCGCCSVLLGARLPLGIVGCGASLVFVFEKADFMSSSLYLKSGNGLSDVLLVFALGVGAFGAGLTTVGFWVGAIVMVFAFGLIKVSLSRLFVNERGSLATATAASLSPCSACRGVT